MKLTKIVNKYTDNFDVYIGRGSPFGNPYTVSKYGRRGAIDNYQIYFLERIRSDSSFLQLVNTLRGKTLGCFCKPKECHGDIIADWLNKKMRLAIVGARKLMHDDDAERSALIVKRLIAKYRPDEIITGGALGIDDIVYQVAQEFDYSEGNGLVVFRPSLFHWNGSGGIKERNITIARTCTHLVRIHCKRVRSYGSGWTADYATSLGKKVIRWVPCRND